MMGTVWISEKAAEELDKGALHVYAQNVEKAEGNAGDWVEIRYGNEVIGWGFYNPKSAIALRLFAREEADPKEIIFKRIEDAESWKGRIYENTYRWIFAEGDLLPGLVLDRFENVAVVLNQTRGLEKYLKSIAGILKEYGVDHVYLKGKGKGRKREGLPQKEAWLIGGIEKPVVVEEGNARFYVDAVGGQKTGLYLDQRENRIELERFVQKGDEILDVFASTGGFGIHAAVSGGKATFVELGRNASRMIERNMKLNKVKGRIITADALDAMKRLERKGKKYDVVVLDPPALAKGRGDADKARKMYFQINQIGMKLLREGGLLITCSCSYPITPKDFIAIARWSAEKDGRIIKMMGSLRGQAPDHSVYLPQPETQYLKCMFARIE